MSENETEKTALGPGAREAVDGDLSKPYIPEDVSKEAALTPPAPLPHESDTGPGMTASGIPPVVPTAPSAPDQGDDNT